MLDIIGRATSGMSITVKRNAVAADAMGFDVIGDIHGQLGKWRALMVAMGYPEKGGSFGAHPEGRVPVKTGDFIDRGPHNLGVVVEGVLPMVENGHAIAIQGNHKFNAVRWTLPDPHNPGDYLRPHTEKNRRQHAAFLREKELNPAAYDAAINWFKTLPVYLVCGKYRFVHACWHQQSIDLLHGQKCLDDAGRLTEKGWALHPKKDADLLRALEILLKGPKEPLGHGFRFQDSDGDDRTIDRIAWWRENPETYAEAFCSLTKDVSFGVLPYQPVAAHPLSQEIRQGLKDLPPDTRIFIGHLSLEDAPQPLSENVACVDYSCFLPTGTLMAYRTRPGETTLNAKNYFWVPCP